MDDLNQQISQFLSDPNSMQQLQGVLSSLGMNGGGTPAQSPPAAPAGQGMDLSALAGMLGALGKTSPATGNQSPGGLSPAPAAPGGVSPEMLGMVTKLAPLLSQVNQEDDSTRLLMALRPLLGQTRQKKVDEAMKILQMMRLLPLLKDSGVFSGLLSGLI